METNVSYELSNEDLVGVLRTIFLFLESINFKSTSAVLQNECSSKGYREVVSAPAKIVVVHPSPKQFGTSNQGNQTDFPDDDETFYVIESTVADEVTESEDNRNPNYLEERVHISGTNYWKNNYDSHVIVSHNINQDFARTSDIVEKCCKEQNGSQKTNPNKQNKNLECQRAPNTIESECPTKISSKKFSKNSLGEKQWFKKLRKTRSNPSLKIEVNKVDDKNNEDETNNSRHSSTMSQDNAECQDLRKRFRQLQNEHRKLMGVTTELTTALQTHILGQSENLNSMLNNCRNIYPDLFKSVCEQNCNNFENVEAKFPTPNEPLENDIPKKPPCNKTMYENTGYAEEISKNVVNQTNVAQDLCSNPGICGCSSPSTNRQCQRNQDRDITTQGSLSPGCAVQNSNSIVKKGKDKRNIPQGVCNSIRSMQRTNINSDYVVKNSVQSTKTIGKSANDASRPVSSNIPQDKYNISQGSLPACKSIQNNDNIIIQSSSPSRDNQNSGNVSKSSPPLTKTNKCCDNSPKKIEDKCNASQSSGSLDRNSIRNSDNILLTLSPLKQKQISENNSQNSASPSTRSIRNSDHIILQPRVRYEKKVTQEEEVLVEITRVDSNGSQSTTIVTPTLKRPNTSNIILVTTIDESRKSDSKILLRQLSSKSLDESLLNLNETLPCELADINANYNRGCNAKCTEEEVTVAHTTQIPEVKNVQQQTSNSDTTTNQELYQETPEIFVTTENLEKLQHGCTSCKSPGESHASSPRNMYFDLDFRKLKKDMLNGDDNLKLGLIQALRWRITQSDSATRDQVISSYIRHDLLGLHSAPNSCGQSMTEIYYCPNKETPHPLQEGMARLVNTFASLTLGRDYLCQDDDLVISLLVPLVIGTHYSKVKINHITRDMLMATLQKLSIRNRQRVRMISAGLVGYLVTFLATEHATISEYCMEYTTALLMNLCLHREARDLLHSSATDVVSLLADLMNTKYRSCMPYVNGAMYSLLGDPNINKEAQRLNLAKLIEYHMKRTDGEMRRQLEFILKLHLNNNGQNECGCDPNLEPEHEVDLLEPELDNGDSINAQLAGEEILKNYRLLFSNNGAQVNALHLKCLCRPITPRVVHSYQTQRNVRDNCQKDKTVQAYQDEIVEDTNFQLEETTVQCTCVAEKAIQSENSDSRGRSQTPTLCMCRTTPTVAKKVSDNSNTTFPINTKHGNSVSEPITGLKNDTAQPIKKPTVSARSSRSNSPEMSYSEETKQFYHTPSAKTGIFEPQKQRKLHRVPPSFTRTIPLTQKVEPLPAVCDNPFCPNPYSKTMPVSPKENSSVTNPPYGLDYPVGFTRCYREGYINQRENSNNPDGSNPNCTTCSNNNKPSRYRCNCYNVIRGYIDQPPQNNITSNKNENSCTGQQETEKNFLLPTQNVCHSSNNVYTGGPTPQNFNYTPINHGNEVLINFSYEELLKTVRPDNDHVCLNPGADCQCYDVVFQSRPKILRTPP